MSNSLETLVGRKVRLIGSQWSGDCMTPGHGSVHPITGTRTYPDGAECVTIASLDGDALAVVFGDWDVFLAQGGTSADFDRWGGELVEDDE